MNKQSHNKKQLIRAGVFTMVVYILDTRVAYMTARAKRGVYMCVHLQMHVT